MMSAGNNASVNFGEAAQMGDSTVNDVVAGDKMEGNTIFHGVSGDRLVDLLVRFLDKEPQRAELREAARVMGQRSTDQRLDRIAGILNKMVVVLSLEVAVLSLVLLVGIGMLFLLAAGPRLVALVGL